MIEFFSPSNPTETDVDMDGITGIPAIELSNLQFAWQPDAVKFKMQGTGGRW